MAKNKRPPPTERAWAAGFFDGEGSWTPVRASYGLRVLQLCIANTDISNLTRFQKVVGGNITRRRLGKNWQPHYKPCFTLRVTNHKGIQRAAGMLLPYMGNEKTAQYRAAARVVRESRVLPLEDRRKLYTRQGKPLSV